jgi:capsid protein
VNQSTPSDNGSSNSKPIQKKGGKRNGAGRLTDSERVQKAIFKALGSTAFPGAEPYQPGRTWIYYPLTDPRRELTAQSRTQLLMKARFLYNAIGLARRAINGPACNAVGSGLSPCWKSEDEDWNQEMAQRFEEGPGRNPLAFDAAGRVNFYEAQPLVLSQVGLDGDFFAQPLQAEDGSIRARFIEGTFVGNSGRTGPGFDEKLWFDGVRTNSLGLPIAYRVLRDPMDSDQFTDVPADEMWHICNRQRHGYVRGVSSLATACNHMHDLMDIGANLKTSYKTAAQFPFTIITERGNITLGAGLTSQTNDTTGQTQKTMQMRSESGVPTLLPGESIASNNITIPGETFDPFSNYLIRDIAWGCDTSPEVLWNILGTGGANVRYVVAEAQRFYEQKQDLYIYGFGERYVRAWTFAEIETGRSKFVKDWAKIRFHRPAKLTVDNGRDGKLLMEQMAAGFLNPDYVHALLGNDGAEMDRQAIRTKIRRIKMVADEAKAAAVDLEPEDVFPAQGAGPDGSAPPTPGSEDEPPAKPGAKPAKKSAAKED